MASTDSYTHAFADNVRLAKSKFYTTPTDGTYNIIQLPRYSFVKDVWIQIVTAASAVPTALTVGWAGNGETAVTGGFISTDIANPTVVGLKRAQGDTAVSFEGKYFSEGSGTITFTYTAGSDTTCAFRIFADYVVIH